MIPPCALKARRLPLLAGAALQLLAEPAFAADLRLVTWNVENGVGRPGSAAFGAVRETLERLTPDVIVFQEVDVQDASPSSSAHFADLRALLTALGLSTDRAHWVATGDVFQAQSFAAGDFGNGSQSLVVASRHAITRAVQIGRGVSGRREQTRFPLFVSIAVPGAERELALVAVHLKQGDTQADEFRRAVEALRVREFLAGEGVSGAFGRVVVAGDMNEELNEPQTASFPTTGVRGGHVFGDGSALPLAYQVGAGVPEVLRYSVFPTSGFTEADLSVVAATQSDGRTDRTYTYAGNSRLDYVLVSSAILSAGAVRAEVYHSGREPVGDGLPKAASLPRPDLSLTASDHLPVVVDLMLESKPALTLRLPLDAVAVGFEATGVPRLGEVAIDSARSEPLMVTIAPFRAAPVARIPPVVIPAGEVSTTFPLVIAGSPYAPDRRVTLVARATGHRDSIGSWRTMGTGVSGPLIISQYTETPSGSTPKAIEVMNVSSRTIDFAAEPLEVRSFASGSSTGSAEILAENGRLPGGAVIAIGDTATAQFLIARGVLPVTAAQVANAPTGTVFTDTGDPDGCAVFIKRGFLFNGDDALEVRLNARRCDIFGLIGQDPGTAWSGRGVSTANQNLSRRRSGITASPGWTDPSAVFETAGTTPSTALDGFGAAPVLDDPYVEWALDRGLTGAHAALDSDPDGNGIANGLEFVFGQAGPVLTPILLSDGRWECRVGPQVRSHFGPLRWGVATATSLDDWTVRCEAASPLGPDAAGFSPLSLALPSRAAASGQARVFVTRP
ncbi:MAG: endonuclease/exonuclease/phosphatase family protein [Verrucomicrobiales bacterium]